jgi:hypothetical protein
MPHKGTELKTKVVAARAALQANPTAPVTNATLDPFTILIEDIIDFLIELADAII